MSFVYNLAEMDREKFTMQKFIKEEKSPGQRLQSIRLPRDLSLGGTKQNKKQFIPNLNVIRNKDKAKAVIRKTEQRRKERTRDNRERKSGDRYVQSTGIFSEGVAGEVRRSHHISERWGGSKENDGGSYMSIPTIKKNSWHVQKENEQSVLDEIMNQDEESDDEKLPFQPITWNESVLKEIKIPIKPEINNGYVKTEPEESVIEPTFKNLKLEQSVYSTLPKEYNYQDLHSNNPTLTLWSLPDSFAGKGLSEDPNCKKLFDYGLNDMTEGQIGKLVIRQSGRIEIFIGRVKYDLDPMELESCAEDIVALDVKENLATASVLGQIQNRFLLNPSWESLLL